MSANRSYTEHATAVMTEALLDHLTRPAAKKAYIDPVISKLRNEALKGRGRDYAGLFKALKRAVKELSDNWKLEHGPMSGTGAGKAGEDRAITTVTEVVMEEYQALAAKDRRILGTVKSIEADINRKLGGG